MKKTVLISVACTLAAVLVIGLVVLLILGGDKPKNAADDVETFSTYEGEIVEIESCDEGYLLRVGVPNNSDGIYEIVRVLVDKDTELSGSFMGFSLQELLEEQVAGIFVSAEISDDTVTIDGQSWHPVKTITITEE